MNIIGVDVYTNNAIPVDLVVVKGDEGLDFVDICRQYHRFWYVAADWR